MRAAPVALFPTLAALLVWGAHFGAIYAVHALACERGLSGRTILGLPLVPAAVAAATLLALAALAPLLRRAAAIGGGEEEPGFTSWFAGAAAVLAALGVLFQAAPAFVLRAC